MNVLIFLIPITLALSLIGLITFLWNLRNKQYEDLDGAANRILFDEEAHRNGSIYNKTLAQKKNKKIN